MRESVGKGGVFDRCGFKSAEAKADGSWRAGGANLGKPKCSRSGVVSPQPRRRETAKGFGASIRGYCRLLCRHIQLLARSRRAPGDDPVVARQSPARWRAAEI